MDLFKVGSLPQTLKMLLASLRLRLLAGTLAWTLLTIALAAWGLRTLFQDHITQQLEAQLRTQLDQLSAALEVDATGKVSMANFMADPRLQQPLSGLYWQVDRLDQVAHNGLLRSRSLWDQVLAIPNAATGWLTLHDAQQRQLLANVRRLQLPEEDAPALRLIVAADTELLAEPLERFTRLLLSALGILALGLLMVVALQLQLALRPLRRLRHGLMAVRSGAQKQLLGHFPQELTPLVGEFNHVLAENAAMLQHARTQAGNLAHALHTPLSILANAALDDASPLAQLVREQVSLASRQVDYHLARARASAAVHATGLRTPVLPVVQGLLRTMQRLHSEAQIHFALAPQAADLAFRGAEQDLYELLGNLLDNAGKWARQQVLLDVQREAAQLRLTVDDDGPGIPEENWQRMFERGVQLDEQRPGTGLGLDIVRTLAETYGGSIAVQAAPLGGARFILKLPAVDY